MTTTVLQHLIWHIVQWPKRRSAKTALSALDDRMLRDAGVERQDIGALVDDYFRTRAQTQTRRWPYAYHRATRASDAKPKDRFNKQHHAVSLVADPGSRFLAVTQLASYPM